MKTRVFLVCVIVLVILGGFFLYRAQPVRLETVLNLSLRVLPESSQVDGTGWIYDETMNFSVLKWPGFGDDKVSINLQRSDDKTRELPVKFLVRLRLNQNEKIIETPAMKDAGEYIATLHCYFDNIKSGSYNLEVSLFIDGLNDVDDQANVLVFIP